MSQVENVNPLSLSDDDFLNAPHEPVSPAPVVEPEVVTPVTEEPTLDTEPALEQAEQPDELAQPGEDGAAPAGNPEDNDAQNPAETTSAQAQDGTPAGPEGAAAEPPAVDHQAEYARIMAPFKANGREIQVKSTDEAIRLMQMGANYNKKMEGLKPSMKLLKMLSNNELLDEQKLSFLIDISKKDPAAIQQLLKDSNVDPLSIDLDNAPKYAPGNHSVSDKEVELDTVLDEVESTPTGQRTIQTVTGWDESSKRILAENPQVISAINTMMGNGIYDQIASEVDRRKVLGDLNNLSALDAFKLVGDELQAKGLLQAAAHAQTASVPVQPVPVATRVKVPAAETDAARAAKARAAGTTKSSARPAKEEFNPLSMSDEEFEKLSSTQF